MDRLKLDPERRRNRRMALGCGARLFVHGRGDPLEAVCTELAVGGLTVRAAYVPRAGEVLKVLVASPPGGIARPPLQVRATVRRCQRLSSGQYEIGLEIVEVLE